MFSIYFTTKFNLYLLFYNLFHFTALKQMLWNIERKGLAQWFLNELCPSVWTTADEKLVWIYFQPEMLGWCSHILIGAAFTYILGISPLMMALLALGFEVTSFVLANAFFINPINALIDILFYVFGSYIILTIFNTQIRFARMKLRGLIILFLDENNRVNIRGRSILLYVVILICVILSRGLSSWLKSLLPENIFGWVGGGALVLMIFGVFIQATRASLRKKGNKMGKILGWSLFMWGILIFFSFWEIMGLWGSETYPRWNPRYSWNLVFLFWIMVIFRRVNVFWSHSFNVPRLYRDGRTE
jgi:hypothetical protein